MTKDKLSHTKDLDEMKKIALDLFDENKLYKSEKTIRDDGQLSLFDIPEPELPISEEPENVIIPGHSRKKRGRRPLPDHLPRVDVVHELNEEERQ